MTSRHPCRVAMLVQNSVEHDTRVRKEAESLAAYGYDVHVLGHAAAHLPVRETVTGVSYHRLPVPRGLASLGLRRPAGQHAAPRTGTAPGPHGRRSPLAQARRRTVSTVSVLSRHTGWAIATRPTLEALAPATVHAHDLDSLLAACMHLGRHPETRLVYDAHELELHRNAVWTPWRRAVAGALESSGIRRAHAVLTVSPLIADALTARYGVRRPTVILNSPRLEARDLQPALNLRAATGLASGERLVVYVGGMLWRRGLEQLVAALGHLQSGVHLGVLGDNEPEAAASLRVLAHSLGVADRLHLLGAVPAASVPATLREGADATVIPIPNVCRSYDLALPNKLFDSVMAGVPVGVGRLEHMRRFVIEHELGSVFDETDPGSMAAAIDQLITSPRRGLSRDRLDALQRQVAWERQEEELLSVYTRLRDPKRR